MYAMISRSRVLIRAVPSGGLHGNLACRSCELKCCNGRFGIESAKAQHV